MRESYWRSPISGHPVMYISKTLSQAEQRYCNIEREALAMVFVVKRLKQFYFTGNSTSELIIVLWNSYLLQTSNSQNSNQQEAQESQFRLPSSSLRLNTKDLRFLMPAP